MSPDLRPPASCLPLLRPHQREPASRAPLLPKRKMVEKDRLRRLIQRVGAACFVEAGAALDRRRTAVVALKRMLSVPGVAHRQGDLRAQGLKVQRMPAQCVVRLLGWIVVEEASADDSEFRIERPEVLVERQTARAMWELVRVQEQPPDVLVLLRSGDLSDDLIHLLEPELLVVASGSEDAREDRACRTGCLDRLVRAAVVDDVDTFAALGARVGHSGFHDVGFHPSAEHGEQSESCEACGTQRVQSRLDPAGRKARRCASVHRDHRNCAIRRYANLSAVVEACGSCWRSRSTSGRQRREPDAELETSAFRRRSSGSRRCSRSSRRDDGQARSLRSIRAVRGAPPRACRRMS